MRSTRRATRGSEARLIRTSSARSSAELEPFAGARLGGRALAARPGQRQCSGERDEDQRREPELRSHLFSKASSL